MKISGFYNLTAAGETSWYGFAQSIAGHTLQVRRTLASETEQHLWTDHPPLG